jgi:hypothetical protein
MHRHDFHVFNWLMSSILTRSEHRCHSREFLKALNDDIPYRSYRISVGNVVDFSSHLTL